MKNQMQSISVLQNNYHKIFEQTIDADFVLPDYCPEIMRLVKCTYNVEVDRRDLSENKLNVEGHVRFCLLYLSEEDVMLNTFTHVVDFGKTIELPPEMTGTMLDVECTGDYITTRATGKRTITLQGAVHIEVNGRGIAKLDIPADFDMPGLQKKQEHYEINAPLNLSEKSFFTEVEQNCDFAKNIREMLFYTAATRMGEVKVMADKCILKGYFDITCHFLTFDNQIKTATYEIPFSQMLDAGFNGECNAVPCVRVYSCNVEAMESESEQLDYIQLSILANAQLILYTAAKLDLISDVFHTQYETEFEAGLDQLSNIQEQVMLTSAGKCSVVSQNGGAVYAVWCTPTQKHFTSGDGKNNMVVHVACNVLFGTNGDYYCCEKTVQVPLVLPQEDDSMGCDVLSLAAKVESFRQTGEGECEVNVVVNAALLPQSTQTVRYIKNVELLKDKPLQREGDVSLFIYYAKEGEEIFSVAKQFCTSPKAIMEENEMESDVCDKKGPIMIPVVDD